jgi:predicted nuclease of predicted toxin-antitoxin system
MRFLVDAQLPPGLARLLVELGHEAEHVVDVRLRDADDSSIWDFALDTGACILTKDEDFVKRISLTSRGPAVVWLRVGNCSNTALFEWFKPLLPRVVACLAEGERWVELV